VRARGVCAHKAVVYTCYTCSSHSSSLRTPTPSSFSEARSTGIGVDLAT
jgi:hypothetical protein